MFSIIHGAEETPTLGGLQLPPESRLRVSERTSVRVSSYEQIDALNISTGKPGILAMWAYSVDNSSMGYAYIEGCQRWWTASSCRLATAKVTSIPRTASTQAPTSCRTPAWSPRARTRSSPIESASRTRLCGKSR